MNIALFGPPGSGKGTQANLLCERFDMLHLSTGDLLRAERDTGSALGDRVGKIMNKGDLVPDEIVSELLQKEVQKAFGSGSGVLFDGFPRNLHQLFRLEALLTVLDSKIHGFISLAIGDDAVIERLTSRRTCSKCNRVYNLATHPPRQDGICDECGGELKLRTDDTPEAISRRLREYREQTMPLMDHLSERGRMFEVSANRPIAEVQSDIASWVAGNFSESSGN